MSTSMLEKVAKSLYGWNVTNTNIFMPSWDNLLIHAKQKYLDAAKIAIEALREPTNEMATEYYKLSFNTDVFYIAHWQRAIDTILKGA